MYDYIEALLAEAVTMPHPPEDDMEAELRRIRLLSRARVVLDIMEAQSVHALRSSLPQASYDTIGHAQGISKQASRIRHTKLEQVLKVHQLDGRRHTLAKAVVSTKHRRAAKPARRARKAPVDTSD